jgi:hypothetical protein
MTELVARHACPESEEALLAEARSSTVRAMRSRLRDDEEDAQPLERKRSLQVTVSREDGWALEATRMLLDGCGASSTEAFVEALLAEGLTALQGLAPESAHAELDSLEERSRGALRGRRGQERGAGTARPDAASRCGQRTRSRGAAARW